MVGVDNQKGLFSHTRVGHGFLKTRCHDAFRQRQFDQSGKFLSFLGMSEKSSKVCIERFTEFEKR